MIRRRDPHSGALVFVQEPYEKQAEQSAKDMEKLMKEFSSLKGTVTKLTNRIKELESGGESNE